MIGWENNQGAYFINKLASETNDNANDIKTLNTTVGEHTTKIANLETTVGGHTTKIANLESKQLAYIDGTSGNYTIGDTHYTAIERPVELSGKTVVCAVPKDFTSISGAFSIITTPTREYVVGDTGTTLTAFVLRYWYIVGNEE